MAGNTIFDRGEPATGETPPVPLDDVVGDGELPLVTTTPMERGGSTARPPVALQLTRRERKARRKERIRRRRTVFGRHPKTTVALVILLALTPIWVSAGKAATDPALGTTVGARLTEWFRDHGGSPVVNWAENVWYTWHAPPKGGKPPPGAIPHATQPTPTTVAAVPHLAPPAAIVPFVATPLAGEGQWRPIGRTVQSVPAMYAAYLRPNAVNTSLVTGVAWMDTKLLAATLYGGSIIPSTGPPWPNEAPISAAAASTLDAAFNSGFRMSDANGGFYLDGMTSPGYPLVTGAASFVITADGTPTVGAWGTDVKMSPAIVAVRQNLSLIVDGGQPVPGLDANDNHRWGNTLGGKVQVWRSGVGVTADGALVYAAGTGLSIVDLANVLARAGAIRAMELDINTSWVNFSSFAPVPGQLASPANGTRLTMDEQSDPSRYFAPLSRDFITMSVRPPAAPVETGPAKVAARSGSTTTSSRRG